MFCCFSRVDVGMGEPNFKASACQTPLVTVGRSGTLRPASASLVTAVGVPFAQRSKHHSRLAIVDSPPRERSITSDCRVVTLRPESEASLATVGSALSLSECITRDCRSACPSLRERSITSDCRSACPSPSERIATRNGGRHFAQRANRHS